jgi:hypothetical protein
MVVSGETRTQTGDDPVTAEVDEMRWVDADEAAAWLTYPDEKALVAQNWAEGRGLV